MLTVGRTVVGFAVWSLYIIAGSTRDGRKEMPWRARLARSCMAVCARLSLAWRGPSSVPAEAAKVEARQECGRRFSSAQPSASATARGTAGGGVAQIPPLTVERLPSSSAGVGHGVFWAAMIGRSPLTSFSLDVARFAKLQSWLLAGDRFRLSHQTLPLGLPIAPRRFKCGLVLHSAHQLSHHQNLAGCWTVP